MSFLVPIANKQPTEDIPNNIGIRLSTFRRLKDKWLYWNALKSEGKEPVSFLEAKQIPKEELDFYLTMDSLLSRLYAQNMKKSETQ